MSFKIPQINKKFSVTNKSDVSGNIWYTKNLDLDEEGYIKLSSRMVQIISDSNLDSEYDTDFNIVSSIGLYGSSGSLFLVSNEEPFVASLLVTNVSATEDTVSGNPSLTQNSRGRWYKNEWHVSSNTAVTSKSTAGTWTSRITGLTASTPHPIEVFRNRNSIVVGNGNVLKQYDSSYANTTDLTIPTDYSIIDACYSNNKIGVITTLSTASDGQNQEAFFFVWDGGSTSANAGFPIGAVGIASIKAYKSSWAITTKDGRILYFNGGGFDELARFPFFSKDRMWDLSGVRGDVMIVNGDLININFNGALNINGLKQEQTLQNNPGGIWCYNPDVGLYQKWSPSISQAYNISVLNNGVNTSTDLITADSGTIPITGSPIKLTFSTSDPIGGLIGGQVYYVINVSPTTFRLATTKENAKNGVYIDLTSNSGTTSYFLALVIKDYGQSFLNTAGALALTDTKNLIYDGILASFRGYNSVGTVTNYFGMNIVEFDNIGYLVTPKLEAEEITDLVQKEFLKNKPLKDNDSIIIKYKDEELVGIPVSTPIRGTSCVWTSNTTLTLAEDLSEVLDYLSDTTKECELEVISGAGGGQMSQIASITENAGVYTITLDDEIEGVSANDTCNIIIDNWKELCTITNSEDLGYNEESIATTSKATKIKIILKGTGVTLEELQVITSPQQKSI